jgi:hypothetical protein
MMRPIIAITLNVSPVTRSVPAIPTIDSGSDNMMASGSTNDSNCAARIR